MQNYTSANTSINSTKLPMVYSNSKALSIIKGRKVIDIGGGKFDNAVDFCKTIYTDLSVYDKYNRTEEHNERVLSEPYDVAIISNVLNVIDDKSARADVIALASDMANTILITVYEGNRSGIGKVSKKDCWQENRKTEDYIEEIEWALGENWTVKRYGKLIVAEF